MEDGVGLGDLGQRVVRGRAMRQTLFFIPPWGTKKNQKTLVPPMLPAHRPAHARWRNGPARLFRGFDSLFDILVWAGDLEYFLGFYKSLSYWLRVAVGGIVLFGIAPKRTKKR